MKPTGDASEELVRWQWGGLPTAVGAKHVLSSTAQIYCRQGTARPLARQAGTTQRDQTTD